MGKQASFFAPGVVIGVMLGILLASGPYHGLSEKFALEQETMAVLDLGLSQERKQRLFAEAEGKATNYVVGFQQKILLSGCKNCLDRSGIERD